MPYWFTRLVGLLLRDQRFRVHMDNDTSAWRSQRNGLRQGSVLTPVLFNLAVWLSGNTLASINVVALRQTRLVLGWVTVCGRVNHPGM